MILISCASFQSHNASLVKYLFQKRIKQRFVKATVKKRTNDLKATTYMYEDVPPPIHYCHYSQVQRRIKNNPQFVVQVNTRS